MRKIYITATSVNADTEEEYHGWIDWNWSPFELYENKEDVRYIELEDGEDERQAVYDLIGSFEEPESHTPGRYYAHDSKLQNGEYWSYCAHVED